MFSSLSKQLQPTLFLKIYYHSDILPPLNRRFEVGASCSMALTYQVSASFQF